MAYLTQQGLIFGCHMNFKAITSDGDKDIICNLSNKQDKILEVQNSYILKGLGGPTAEQKDKWLYYRAGDQI